MIEVSIIFLGLALYPEMFIIASDISDASYKGDNTPQKLEISFPGPLERLVSFILTKKIHEITADDSNPQSVGKEAVEKVAFGKIEFEEYRWYENIIETPNGTNRILSYFDSDSKKAIVKRADFVTTRITFTPAIVVYDYPLYDGKSWTQPLIIDAFIMTPEFPRPYPVRKVKTMAHTTVNMEKATVPAGIFDVLHVKTTLFLPILTDIIIVIESWIDKNNLTVQRRFGFIESGKPQFRTIFEVKYAGVASDISRD